MLSLRSTIRFCAFLLFTLIAHECALAQSEESKIEVGAQFSALTNRSALFFDRSPILGGGGRVTVNLTRYLALEGELNYFPSAGFDDIRKFQGQFGIKSGLRFERFGVFGKARPGFINTQSGFRVFCPSCPPGTVCILPPCVPARFTFSETSASLDVGGVFEFYPLKRVTVRFDIGDTMINQSVDKHTLQLSAGVGYRF